MRETFAKGYMACSASAAEFLAVEGTPVAQAGLARFLQDGLAERLDRLPGPPPFASLPPPPPLALSIPASAGSDMPMTPPYTGSLTPSTSPTSAASLSPAASASGHAASSKDKVWRPW